MAYSHYQPSNVEPSGSNQPLTGLNITWDASTVSVEEDLIFRRWTVSLNGSTIYTSTDQATRSYSYSGTLAGSTDYSITVSVAYYTSPGYPTGYFRGYSSSSSIRTVEIPSSFSLTSPANAAIKQSLTPTLSWGTSTNATSYDVYLGTDSPPTNVYNGAAQTGTTKITSTLTEGEWYYWKIVAKNANGTYTSAIWSFRACATPEKAITPTPEDLSEDESRSQLLRWADGDTSTTGYGTADTYNVYFGTDSTPGSNESQGSQTGLTFNPGTLKAATTYYWRIDSVNAAGTTTGDVWSFTTGEIAAGTPADRKYKRKLVAAADNKFFYEDNSVPAILTELSGLELDTTKPLTMTEAYQKIFIANDDKKVVVDFCNTILHYTNGLAAPPAKNDVLTQATTGASMTVDYVSRDLKKIYGFTITDAHFDTTYSVAGSPSDTLSPTSFIPTDVTTPNTDVLTVAAMTTAPVADDILTQAVRLTVPAITTAPAAGDILTQVTGGIDSYTKLCLNFDQTTTPTDSSSGAKTMTLRGNAAVSTLQYKFGTNSLLLDGTGDWVDTPDHADWDFGTGDWTMDLWVRFTALPSTDTWATFLSQYASDSAYWQFGIYNDSGTYYIRYYDKASDKTIQKVISPGTGIWYHCAAVRYGNVGKIYITGSAGDETDLTGVTMPDIAGVLQIGAYNGGAALNGNIDEVRISKGIARWTGNFTKPSVAYSTTTATLTVTVVSDLNIFGYATGTFDTVNGFTSNNTGATMSPASIVPESVTGGSTIVVVSVNADKTQIVYKYPTGTIYTLTNYIMKSNNTGATMNPANIQPVNKVTDNTPHYYDWEAYPDLDGGDANEFGSIFDKATICRLYLGKVFLSGNSDYPHQFQLSRQGSPWDFQYFANDAQSATGGASSDLGKVGDIVVDAAPYSNDYMILFCDNSIWVMRGDPANNGSVDQIEFTTGLWGKGAWCWDGSGNLYFLGSNDICKIPAGLGSLVNLTKDTMPDFMKDWSLDKELHRVTMNFDPARHGLNICKTNLETGENQNYWFDLRVGTDTSGGFFPETYPEECAVYSSHFYASDEQDSKKTLLGCADGYIRYFDDTAKDDDIGATVQTIESDILLGPIPISANSSLVAMTNAQTFVTAGGGIGGSQGDTDSITYQIFIAKTAEEIIEQVTAAIPDPKFTGTITGPGSARRKRHRGRGVFMGIRILNITAGETWAIDRVLCDIRDAGRVK